jgi:hypothetical protein
MISPGFTAASTSFSSSSSFLLLLFLLLLVVVVHLFKFISVESKNPFLFL